MIDIIFLLDIRCDERSFGRSTECSSSTFCFVVQAMVVVQIAPSLLFFHLFPLNGCGAPFLNHHVFFSSPLKAVVVELLIRYADSIFTPIELSDSVVGRDMLPLNA